MHHLHGWTKMYVLYGKYGKSFVADNIALPYSAATSSSHNSHNASDKYPTMHHCHIL